MNADEIAKGLSPFQPEKVAFEAGRIMLKRIRELINERIDFAFETTLSTKSYRPLMLEAKAKGYKIILIFLWLESVGLAKERVRQRAMAGGHNIADDIIERRYIRGLKNLRVFTKIVDHWAIWDNSHGEAAFVAESDKNGGIIIYNNDIWNQLYKQ